MGISLKTGIKIGLIALAALLLAGGCAKATPVFQAEEAFAQNALEGEGWSTYQWEQQAQFAWDPATGHDAPGSMRIDAPAPEDARLVWSMDVESDTAYRFSCWVRTEGVGSEGLGANLSALGLTGMSENITGTTSWQYLEWYGNTGPKQDTLDLTLGLGGYGRLNEGTAWFDDVMVEKVNKMPADVAAASLYTADTAPSEEETPVALEMGLTLAVIVFIGLIILLMVRLWEQQEVHTHRRWLFWVLLAAGLGMRLILAASYPGLSCDMSCFRAWTLTAGQNLLHFYQNAGFADYPPLYIYVLGLVGGLARLLGLDTGGTAFILLVKSPAIIADLIVAVLLYRYAVRQKNEGWGFLLMTLYVLNPALWINSALWGQVDSVLTLWLVLFLFSIERRNLHHAAAWLALAVLTKPQGLLLAPILLFAWIREGDVRKILRSVAWGAGAFLLIILPFAVQHGPLWIFGLLKGTTDQYAYASFNGYNLFSLLGANLTADTETLLFLPYKVWGMLFMAASVAYAGYLYLRKKDTPRRVWIAALVLVTGVFVLGFRMHERYLYPAVAFVCFWAAGRKSKRSAWLILPFSITVFANTFQVLLNDALHDGYLHIDPANVVLRIGSLLNCLLLGYLVYVSLTKEKEPIVKPVKPLREPYTYDKEKLGKKDIGLISLITGIYLIAALINLGGFDAPRSCWTTGPGGDTVEITLEEETALSAFSWYGRLGEGSFTVSAADSTGQYHSIATFESSAYPDFGKWRHAELETPVTTGRIRVTADSKGVEIAEMGWFDTAGKAVPVTATIPGGPADALHPVADEPDRVAYYHSYLTGTYFDEIYHVRTAYEQMEHIQAYEYTHPPLGKIIISAGIALFGMTPFGWRLVGTLFGAAMIPLMYFFGYEFFGRRRWATVTALLMTLDFMHFTQTRMATVDTYTAFFTIWMFYFMYRYIRRYEEGRSFGYGLWMLCLCGISVGLGAASKWSALYGGLGLAFLFFWDMYRQAHAPASPALGGRFGRQAAVTIAAAVGCFVLIPAAIYTLSYIPFFQVPGSGHELKDMISLQGRMYHYHSDLVATHDFSSPWWSWPLIGRPLWLYHGEGVAEGIRSTLVTMGNPLIWWPTVPAAVLTGIIGWQYRDKRALFLLAAFVGQYLPWILISRIAFIYHFFPILPFGMLCIVYILQMLSREYPWLKKAVWWYLGACLALFIVFYPAISGLPVPDIWIRLLRWLPTWYF